MFSMNVRKDLKTEKFYCPKNLVPPSAVGPMGRRLAAPSRIAGVRDQWLPSSVESSNGVMERWSVRLKKEL
ncbi:MAG: hypothetical protein SRB2_04113 [Desulfobacteraceae bacterium Eth-SRB2]|nr:MAG: hypothetical protein SRB2_04113 [Desulfobacteraceae bacterium Eth-SRB2]